jgi:hypothetical protein
VEAWGVIQPQLKSILQAILQTSGDSSDSSGSSSSGVAAGRVVRPEAVQGAVMAWLAQSLNYGLMYASTGAWWCSIDPGVCVDMRKLWGAADSLCGLPQSTAKFPPVRSSTQ